MYSPPCCLNHGSIWFLKLFTVLLFTVSSLSLFQVSTTRCVKKYFRTFSLQCCLRMVREWPLRPVAVRSWKKSSRFTPSKLCIILNTSIKSLLSRLVSSESSFVFDSLTLYSSSPIYIYITIFWRFSIVFGVRPASTDPHPWLSLIFGNCFSLQITLGQHRTTLYTHVGNCFAGYPVATAGG